MSVWPVELGHSWKIGYVTAMPRGRQSLNPSDWRPISVIPMPSKLLERELVYHFECNNDLDESTCFRKGNIIHPLQFLNMYNTCMITMIC